MKPVEEIIVRQTTVEVIRPLRHSVLRAGLPVESAVFDGDDEVTTIHLGAFERSGEVVGCATIVQRPWNGSPAYQLRGMAIDRAHQSRGIGRMLIKEVDVLVQMSGYSKLLWCNARTPAVGFYESMGWHRVGEQFEIVTAGPHFRMCRQVS